MEYAGIIADIVASRASIDRALLQQRLKEVLGEINHDRREALVSPHTITLGDEFQALYHDPCGLFADLWRVSAALHPARLRYAIGVGGLDTEVNREEALGMDGPVFHRARAAIEEAKELEVMFRVHGDIPGLDLINHSLMLVSHAARDWNANRLAIQAAVSRGMAAKDIAESLAISESAVYKNIDAAALNTIKDLTRDIERMLAQALDQAQ